MNVLYRFPSSVLFLASTLHKLPPLYIFYIVLRCMNISFVLFSITLTLLFRTFYIFNVYDIRYFLIISSVGNNSFFILAVISSRITIFIGFFLIYCLSLFILLSTFINSFTHSFSYSLEYSYFVLFLFLLLLNLASFPPFPGFFFKFFIFMSCLDFIGHYRMFLFFIVVLNVVIIVSYIKVFLKYLVNIYTNTSHLLFF